MEDWHFHEQDSQSAYLTPDSGGEKKRAAVKPKNRRNSFDERLEEKA
jgi:hypothetical protein